MRKTNRAIIVYVTYTVYKVYHEMLTMKDLCLALQPASKEELEINESVDRSEVIYIQIRMPSWWCDWYYSLSLEDRFKFAKIIEQRLKQYGLI